MPRALVEMVTPKILLDYVNRKWGWAAAKLLR